MFSRSLALALICCTGAGYISANNSDINPYRLTSEQIKELAQISDDDFNNILEAWVQVGNTPTRKTTWIYYKKGDGNKLIPASRSARIQPSYQTSSTPFNSSLAAARIGILACIASAFFEGKKAGAGGGALHYILGAVSAAIASALAHSTSCLQTKEYAVLSTSYREADGTLVDNYDYPVLYRSDMEDAQKDAQKAYIAACVSALLFAAGYLNQ